MTTRALDVEDAAAVAALFARSRGAAMPWLPVLHTPDEDLAYFAGQLRGAVSAGVDGPDGLRGFAIARPGWLDHLYVEPAQRRQGIGSRLLDAIRQAVPGDLQLWVFARNTSALGFYGAQGAVELERTDGSGNEEREPDVRLVLPALR